MKPKEVFIGQEVATATDPKKLLGTIESIKDKHTVVVKYVGDTGTPLENASYSVYGIKVLVPYERGDRNK